jgi:hypothetical protein
MLILFLTPDINKETWQSCKILRYDGQSRNLMHGHEVSYGVRSELVKWTKQ